MDRVDPKLLATAQAEYSNVYLFIDGAWCEGSEKRSIPVMNPATGAQMATVARAEKADLDRALAVRNGKRLPPMTATS
jgi:acyl-CoA reductase-like NAD-dependent aldehyde dehydrogenase